MASSSPSASYVVWGTHLDSYGPLDLPTLVSWVKKQRLLADTWIFVVQDFRTLSPWPDFSNPPKVS